MKNTETEPGLLEKVRGFAVAAATIYLIFLATFTYFRSPKLGYVDVAVLMSKYPPAIQAREKIQAQTEEWRKSVGSLEVELSQLNQEILNEGANWDKTTAESKREAFAKKQNEYIRFTRAINDKASQLEQQLTQPIFKDLTQLLKEFAQKKHYRMIFGTLPGGNILFAEQSTEVTDKFLRYIEKKQGIKMETPAAKPEASSTKPEAEQPKVSLKNEEPAPLNP